MTHNGYSFSWVQDKKSLTTAQARALPVEDEVAALILAESLFQGLGHSTLSAISVTEALALLDDPGGVDVRPERPTRKGRAEILDPIAGIITV